MRIVLLALDGEPDRAKKALHASHPGAEIILLPRSALEDGAVFQKLRTLRRLAPDAFSVSTERLNWQQGQNLLLLFGALAGASHGILLDSDGTKREETRPGTLVRSPFRLIGDAWISAGAIARAWRELRRLERTLERTGPDAGNSFAGRNCSGGPLITYLRSTPAAGTNVGGATTHIHGFIQAALELHAGIKVISNDRIAGLNASGLREKVIEPDSRGLTRATFDLHNALLFTDRACREIVSDPPDFIYQRYSRFNWTGVAAALQIRRPLFLEYNGSEVWMGRHWDRGGLFALLERCERLNLAAATRIFVVAEVERRNLEQSGVAPEKIVVNPNGVDTRLFQPNIGGMGVRRELGVQPDEILVGFVGTFGPWHGVSVLTEAISQVPSTANLRFLLVGTGTLLEQAQTKLRENGRAQNAIFTGAVAHDSVPRLMDACDILTSPHVPLDGGREFFGSPTKLFEYMAMGKGIVASRLGQIGDVLEDEKTALLVEPANVSEFINALVRLAGSPELRSCLGSEARRVCVNHYTWRHNARRVLDAYRSLF